MIIQENKLNKGCLSYIYWIICSPCLKESSRESREAIRAGVNEINKHFDAFYYLNQVKTVQNMKSVLFNMHQRKILDNVRKDNLLYFINQSRKINLDSLEIVNYFKNHLKEQTLSEVDERLFELLEKSVKSSILE
jgi:hypothetical protein